MRKQLFPLMLILSFVLLSGCKSAATSAPVLTRTAAPLPGVVAVSDMNIARQLSFAFIQANDVWVSLHGAAPRQVTHLDLSTQQLDWHLVWSADGTKLLAAAINPVSNGAFAGGAWIISLPDGSAASLSAFASLSGCAISCGWLDGRYLVYADVAEAGSHAQVYHIYDTQAQRALSTSLDNQRITEWEVRGGELYFTPYIDSTGTGSFVPGAIKRFDLASNQITTAFTVSEGALVAQGASFAHWDISADGSKIVYYFFGGALHGCPVGIQCKTLYQDTTGSITAIFSSYQAGANASAQINAPIWISPDGSAAAGFISASPTIIASNPPDTLVQQTLPAGNEWSNALPVENHPYGDQILGWISQPAGIVIQRVEEDAQQAPQATNIYAAPSGSGNAHLVETVQAGLVVFAPLG